MKPRFALLLIATLALIGALSACTANGGAIYATIETEKKIDVSTLDQTITVLDLLNVGSGQFPYLVAAGAVFKGTVPDLNNVIGWPNVGGSPIAVTPPVRGALCLAMTSFNSGIYGGFFTSDGSTMGLYKSVGSPGFSFAVADGATAVAAMAGKQITHLQVANGNLFAVVATPGTGTSGFTYELDSSGDGSSFNATNLTGLTTQITGVGYIPGNLTYYVTAGSVLYSGTALNSLSSTSLGFTLANGEELRGVTVDNGHLFIPSSNAAVYYTTDGVTWTKATTTDEVNGRSVGFLTVSTHVDTAGSGVIYLVGADGLGFYTLNITNNTLTKFSDVTVTGLYAGAVRRMLVDPTQNNTVFMGTAGTGLWRATFDPATGAVNSTWIHE
jgi:hypothetical protein